MDLATIEDRLQKVQSRITRAAERFVPDADGKPVLKSFLPLSLSYDHRVINGADAARFKRAFADALAAFEFN